MWRPVMMISVFNRLVVIFAALAILAGAVVTIGVAAQAWPPDILYGWFAPQLQLAASQTTGIKIATIALASIAAVGMIALLIVEVLPLRTNLVHTLSVTDKGTATIENESLCLLAERTAEAIHGVNDVQCFIRDRDEGLIIKCGARVTLGANLLEVNPEMKAKVREAIQQLTGLKVSRVDIKFRFQADKRGHVSVR
jgi:uncharacterized alkaline shock family protein YloU